MPSLDPAHADGLALKAFWAKQYKGKQLLPEVQQSLLGFCLAKGLTMAALPLTIPVDKDDLEDWVDEVKDMALEAGLTGDYDIGQVVRWLKARSKPDVDSSTSSLTASMDLAQIAQRALELAGPVSDAQAANLRQALATAERDKGNAQYVCIETVWLIYYGLAPSAECIAWYDDAMCKVNAAELGTTDAEGICTVDVRDCPSKLIRHAKTCSLAVVLKSGGQPLSDYVDKVAKELQSRRLGAAAERFRRIMAAPTTQLNMSPTRARQYLLRVFFTDWLGRGLLGIHCQAAVNFFANAPAVHANAALAVPGVVSEQPEPGSAEFTAAIASAVVSSLASAGVFSASPPAGGVPHGAGTSPGQTGTSGQPPPDTKRAWGFCKFCKSSHKNPDDCGHEKNWYNAAFKEASQARSLLVIDAKATADAKAAADAAKAAAGP